MRWSISILVSTSDQFEQDEWGIAVISCGKLFCTREQAQELQQLVAVAA